MSTDDRRLPEDAPTADRRSEDRFRALIEGVSDAVVEIDAESRLCYASPRFEALVGPDGASADRTLFELLHPDDRTDFERALRRLLAEGGRLDRFVRARNRHEEWVWLEVAGGAIEGDRGEPTAALLCRDAGDRVRALERSRTQHDAENRVRELSHRFVALGSNAFDAAIRDSLEAAAQIIGSDRAYLISFVTNGATPHRIFEWNVDGLAAREYDFSQGTVSRYDWVWSRLLEGEIVRLPRLSDAPAEARQVAGDLEAYGIKSYLAIPVRSQGRVLGIMGFHNLREEADWSEQQIALLRLIAELITSALRRQKAEGRLLESEERFRALAENARDGIIEIGSDRTLRYCNPGFSDISGHDRDSLIGSDAFALIHREEPQEPDDERVSLSNEGSRSDLCRLTRSDGEVRWVEMTQQPFTGADGEGRIAAVVRDVTERERRQAQIRERRALEAHIGELARQFLSLGADEIDAAIVASLLGLAKLAGADTAWLLHIDRDSRTDSGVTSALYTPAGCRSLDGARSEDDRWSIRFGWAYKHLSAGNVMQMASPEDLPEQAEVERRVASTHEVQSFLAVPLLAGDDMIGVLGFDVTSERRSWSDEMVALLRLSGDLFLNALRRKRAEGALRQSQRQLLQSQKMEAVGTLAGGIAHDFNNQLSVILGNARFIQRSVAESEDLLDALEDLEQAGQHCARLTRSLLAFSRHSAKAPEEVEIGRVFDDVRQLLGPLIPASIEFDLHTHDELERVVVDPVQLQQVLVNLAVNARDAMPDGGKLGVSTARRFVDGVEAEGLGLQSTGDFLEIAICDSGVGMDDDVQARAFDPFFTTKAPGQGTGLGLAMVYGSVHEWSGSVCVESTPGAGTTFRVYLPLVVSAHARGRHGGPDAPEGGRQSETVLVVEDESRVRRLLRRMLERHGYQVLEAEDGHHALALSRDHEGPIHALVSDLIMPKLGGFDLARMLLAERPDVRVLFQSGYSADTADLPGSRFLQKPFTEDDLAETLRGLLDADGS